MQDNTSEKYIAGPQTGEKHDSVHNSETHDTISLLLSASALLNRMEVSDVRERQLTFILTCAYISFNLHFQPIISCHPPSISLHL